MMDGDIAKNLSDILNSIYLSTNLQSNHINSLIQYLLTHKQEDNREAFNFLLSFFTSRTNSKDRKDLLETLTRILDEKPQLSLTLLSQLSIETVKLKNLVPTKAISKTVLYYSKLYNILDWNGLNSESRKLLITAHSIICSFYAKLGNKIFYEKNYQGLKKYLLKLKSSNFLEAYYDLLKDFSSSSSADINFSILWDNMIRFQVEDDNVAFLVQYKPFVIDLFVKNVISSKSKLTCRFDLNCFQNTLNQINKEEFQQSLFPSIQKANLRNPEVSLNHMIIIIKYLNFDLSDYLQSICKILGNYLHSKNEHLQEESLKIVTVLAQKCTKTDSIEFAIDYFSKIYHGSEGKLITLGQKHSVIKSIGNLSFCNISDSKQNLLNLALQEFLKMFKQETVESSLILLFLQIKIWINNSPECLLPDQFWEFIKNFVKSKSASSSVLTSLYECLILLLSNNKNHDLISTHITKIIDYNLLVFILNSSKNASTPLIKIQIVIESLISSLLLLKIYHLNKNLKEIMKNFLSSMQNLSVITFLTDKFVSQDTPENLLYLVEFIYCLIRFVQLDEHNLRFIYKACLYIMCHSCREVREKAIKYFNEYCLENNKFSLNLIQTFNEIQNNESNMGNKNEVFKLQCCQCLLNQYKFSGAKEEIQNLFDIIHLCHHQNIFELNSKLFQGFLRKQLTNSQIDKLIEDNFKYFVSIALDECKFGEPVTLNVVKTLVKLHPLKFIKYFVQKIFDNLEQHLSEFKSISKEDLEIYKTPEGELYNKAAVIEAANVQDDKNLKRESKLYSHKEQLAEIQLRKELEAKKKDVDQLDFNKMSKKQKEIYNQELEKEKRIRNRLKFLTSEFTFQTNILLSMIDSNHIVTSIHFKEIIFTYVNLFSSILVFEQASDFFKKISHKMMVSNLTKMDGEHSLYVDIISNAIINLYKFSNKQPSNESFELIEHIIDYIYTKTCPNMENYDEKLVKKANQNRLTTPAFSFVFPLFRYVLLNMKNTTVDKCLHIINEHSMIRCYSENDLENLKNPQNLPIKLILETLLKFMENDDAGLNCDELSSTTLIQVTKSVNSEIGCGKATTRDIFILLNYLTHQDDLIRSTCFEGLFILAENVLVCLDDEHCKQTLLHRCYVGQFDILLDCQVYAGKIFEICNFEPNVLLLDIILTDDIENINLVMTRPVSEAYKTLLERFPTELEHYYEKLLEFYQIKASSSLPSVDVFGRPITKNHVDHFESRITIAYIFKHIVYLFNQKQVESFINFLIPKALSDKNELVRQAMLDAGCNFIDIHGQNNINYLLNAFETFLDSAPDDHETDLVRESVIILMGTLAKHIENDNPKLKPILSKLVEALSTPSQIVQEAVANCLQYLIPKFKDDAPALLQKLLEFLFESDIYGERKGAAYGIAGIVKGLGILSINKLGIMDALAQAIQSKDRTNNREGALFAFETLSRMLGRLFEPYIVHILPYLLDCFGDSSVRVRKAADDTAKIIMSNLSAYGVTLIYPAILEALEDDSWRKKESSIELLGSMAFCAPKQLSQCLPKIVPKLMAVITDSHPKVQRSAAEALKQIGSVIKNPEIQEIVPVLLNALQDPANKTNECLNVMMKMKFVHVIDPPSLALIMPVIERSFQNRSAETRKMASQIIGNMYALAKSKDLSPYLPSIVPGLKNSLLDPVPEVRTATARALGAMVKSLGNEILDELRPWLEKMLISETSSVDRSGAAQGLAEVLGGLGKEHLDKYMPKILEVTEDPDVPSYVKDGFIMLYIYLPSVFTEHFSLYISQVINPILKALADENEFVRETALRAGQRIVNMYAETAIQLLLPELERGLFDENWRIRYSSVQLLGDLLFKITGLSGKMTTESHHEDDNFGTEQSHQALFAALGEERRNRVLSGLYMGRSDVSLQVRQASLHVWKVIVPNTPRTLREILPVLFKLLLECLASNSNDRQQIGARTLGDLVRKLGERILPEILPILEDGLKSERPDQRQGVCIGLSEIIASTSREVVQVFADNFIVTVRKALFDSLPEVRQAAARTFDHLHSAIGEKCLTCILTHLLDNIHHPEYEELVLDSLKNIISYKSKVVLPNLIPKLITKPVNTRALSFISSVAGESLSLHLHVIIPPLLSSLSESFDDPYYDQQLEYCQNIVISITDENGVRSVILTLLEALNADLYTKRAAISLLAYYCVQSKPCIIASFRSQILTNLIDLLGSNDELILNHCIEAFNAIIKNSDIKQQLEVVPEVYKKLLNTLGTDSNNQSNYPVEIQEKYFSGFISNKVIQPLISLFNKAILFSNIDVRDYGVNGYRLIVIHSSSEALKPSVTSIAGPLLRILNDLLNSEVKIIAIDILSLLLSKVDKYLKPFFPQIQLIFFRSLIDGNRNVRLQAAICISRLSLVHSKPDSFFTEMLLVVKSCHYETLFLKETAYYAIRLSISKIGEKLSPTIHQQIYEIASQEYSSNIDSNRMSGASTLGALCPFVSEDLLEEIGYKYFLEDHIGLDFNLRIFRCTVLKTALKDAFDKTVLKNDNWSYKMNNAVISYINSTRTPLIINGLRCAAYIIHHSLNRDIVPEHDLLQAFAKSMNNVDNDVKISVATSTIFWSQNKEDIPTKVLKILVPHLVNGTKEKNTMVRSYSEQALITLLKLRKDDSIYEKCLKNMGSGAAESLQDCLAKIKKNLTKFDFKNEEFDDLLML